MKTIAVHNGNFQADDVFAVSILRLIYPEIKIIRSRDPEILKTADIRADVGGKYDSHTNDFDHHQKGGAGARQNGINYSSAGLVWKHFGEKLVSSKEVFDYVDENLIQWIDADDNGINTYQVTKLEPYTIADFIHTLNPAWPNQTNEGFDSSFKEAVSFITPLIKKFIQRAEGIIKAREILREKLKHVKGDYIVLDESLPWKDTIIRESKLKYVVVPTAADKTWRVCAVPISVDSFENRKNLPKEWAGLTGEALQKVTGVDDAIFCHNKLFVAVVKSREGAIKLVELALKDKMTFK